MSDAIPAIKADNLTFADVADHLASDGYDVAEFKGYDGAYFNSEVQTIADAIHNVLDPSEPTPMFSFECGPEGCEITGWNLGVAADTPWGHTTLVHYGDTKNATNRRDATGAEAAEAIFDAIRWEYDQLRGRFYEMNS